MSHPTRLILALVVAGCDGGPQNPLDGFGDAADLGPPAPDLGTQCDPTERLCAHEFRWTFTGGATQPDVVEVRGSFNGWSPGATPMTLSSGVWKASANLDWGSTVEYKFFAQWNNNPNNPLWLTDPNDPDKAGDGNSLLSNVTCAQWACKPGQPHLLLAAAPTTTATSYSFQVRFVPAGAELDETKTIITVNGAPIAAGAVPYDAAARTFTVSVAAGVTSPSKYGYVFRVQDRNGKTATLFVPFWIEAAPFQWKDAFMYEVLLVQPIPPRLQYHQSKCQ